MTSKSPLPRRTPSFRIHKPSGQAFVEIDGKRHYLGKAERPETQEAYHRFITEWISSGYRLPVPADKILILEIVAAYLTYAQGYYVDTSGSPSRENERIKLALRPVVKLYGNVPAVHFGPSALRVVRQAWIDRNMSIKTINDYVSIVKRMLKWAASNEMIPISVYQSVATLSGLRRGRGHGKEPVPREAVPIEDVTATLVHMSSPLKAIVELLLLTAARPTEVLQLKRGDINIEGEVWTAAIREHKTAIKGKQRQLFFGPRAQAILQPFLLRPDSEYLFSPKEAEAERHAKCETHRRPGQRANVNKTSRVIGDFYDHTGLNKAIRRVCIQHAITRWTPYQLRHLAATTIEASADLQTASALLGHSGLNITQVYVHRDNKTAAAWAALHG